MTTNRSAAIATSFSLGDVGRAVIHMPKLDWREKVKEACRGCHETPPEKFYDLWLKHPEILREYNERDAEVLEKLEAHTGYGKLGFDATFQNPRDDDNHVALLRRARTVASVNYRVPVAGWEAGVWVHYTGARADGDPITFATVQAKARTVLDLTASHPLSANWTIGMKAANLTGIHTPEVLGYTPPPPTVSSPGWRTRCCCRPGGGTGREPDGPVRAAG